MECLAEADADAIAATRARLARLDLAEGEQGAVAAELVTVVIEENHFEKWDCESVLSLRWGFWAGNFVWRAIRGGRVRVASDSMISSCWIVLASGMVAAHNTAIFADVY